MTLGDIRALLVQADPGCRHYFSAEEQEDYTYWQEGVRLPFTADDTHLEAWAFTVHRFTRSEYDPTVSRITGTLDACPEVAVRYQGGVFERETGYIHHIWDCEGY